MTRALKSITPMAENLPLRLYQNALEMKNAAATARMLIGKEIFNTA